MNCKYYFIGLLMVPNFFLSQSLEEKTKIASSSDQKANQELVDKLFYNEKESKIRLEDFLINNPNFKRIEILKNSSAKREIVGVNPNGELIYAQTHNVGAATTARANRLYSGGSLGISIQGQNMIAGVWDGGSVRSTHQEFVLGSFPKVNILDGGTGDDHATHVAGTIAAQGINALVRGVAFNSSINSYNWNNDLLEMTNEASTGLLTSNHSYGFGSLNSLWFYGAYDSRARQIDQICFQNPYYLPVFSAGNDRNETTPPGSTQISQKNGYDMIFGHGNAKNIITVAAVEQVSNYVGPSSVVMSSFSSWGPTDDGRIKPDISTKGVQVRSTLNSSDTATGFMSGTSMASPGITGVVLLLQQFHNQLYSGFMRSATVKGLILHTADEAGSTVGPDYSYGWGLVNAEKAAITIRDKNNTSGSKSIIEELTLQNGQTYSKTITASGTQPLKVSISWTDPASSSQNNGTIDPSDIYLVNDLDIKVTKNMSTFYPWKLQGMSAPNSPATRNSTNNVDNFERVDIDNPSGDYVITVSHKGNLLNNSQKYTLIVTSDNLSMLSTKDISQKKVDINFYPNPVKDYIYISEIRNNTEVVIYDISGKLVLSSKLINGKLDVSNLKSGNYIANIKDGNDTPSSFKFIKE
ncbi:S8 family serine peptidase [Chryseobacterium echinoideorum]|uniref:S8 family serine peptidase n=1 Tax=Chryseobacterium echinoideorum TaxID=1549648 RepID=UPI001184DE76|nr:S8 family serine peptidase [Chryseobacterium echinoideorum]